MERVALALLAAAVVAAAAEAPGLLEVSADERRSRTASKSRHLRSASSNKGPRSYGRHNPVAAQYPFMDDLEPVAPFDRVAPPGSPNEAATAKIAPAGGTNRGGARRPAIYVPPYLYPDAFPTTESDTCICEAPKVETPSQEEQIWAAEVAKQLGLPLSQVMHPTDFQGVASCDCGHAKRANGQVYRYVKSRAMGNSSGFTLSSADPTYPSGDYWKPEVVNRAGLVAPGDSMPADSFPPQAPYDEVSLGTGQLAIGDTVSQKFARYFDQVDLRTRDCDSLSEECTSRCAAGDKVLLELGNTRRNAFVIAVEAGNAAHVEFEVDAEGDEECPVEAGCSAFRVCAPSPGSSDALEECVAKAAEESPSWDGRVQIAYKCPKGTLACKTVQQVVQAVYLRKDGKICRAS